MVCVIQLKYQVAMLINPFFWHRHHAGHASQGYPGGTAVRMKVITPKKRRGDKCEAYVVFEGLAPGIYTSWYVSCSSMDRILTIIIRVECKAQVHCVSRNVYQGFSSQMEAERAFVVAYALDALHVLPGPHSSSQPAATNLTPERIMQVFASASDNFLGAEWHVVFKGKRPGVYPAWYFISPLSWIFTLG
jgi:hypothetical protein